VPDAPHRLRVVYVSYDGAGEPLGRSQVLAYLIRMARSCDITLISFEKDQASRSETIDLLNRVGVKWIPRSYHRRPAVVSTAWDVLVGGLAVRRAVRVAGAEIVHVRSYVPALMALLAGWPVRCRGWKGRRWRLLFDIRGFWPDERVLAGAMSKRSAIYRLAKRLERRSFGRADGVVTLTAASVAQITAWLEPRHVPIYVIPTCAEVERFGAVPPRSDGPHAIWCGSVGTFYRFELAVRFSELLGIPFTVLTRQVDEARRVLDGRPADVRSVNHDRVAEELHPGDIGICFYADGFANLARAPTRIAEYLAAGVVPVITRRIGDLDKVIGGEGLGVVVDDETETGFQQAGERALALSASKDFRARAQRLAAELYSVENGVDAYLELYRLLGSDRTTADLIVPQALRGARAARSNTA
jgi:glycosyltransferase involved in cell wall biosynthesis